MQRNPYTPPVANAADVDPLASNARLNFVFSIGIGLANMLGAISLFRLRKIAFYLFAVALISNLLMTVWYFVAKGWGAALGAAGLVGAIIGFGLLVVVCAYSRHLLQRGVLR